MRKIQPEILLNLRDKDSNLLKGLLKKLIDENTSIQKKIDELNLKMIAQTKEQLKSSIVDVNGKSLIVFQGEFPTADVAKQLSFDLKREIDNLVLLLAAKIDEKPMLTVMLGDSVVESGLNANEIIRKMAAEIKGGGGGQPFYATAGGKELSGLEKALAVGKELVQA